MSEYKIQVKDCNLFYGDFQALKNIEREEAAKNPEPSRKKKKKSAGNPPVNDRQNPA